MVAIGELGLDYYRDLSPRDVQRTALVAQLRLARAVGNPCSSTVARRTRTCSSSARRRTWPPAAGSSTASRATWPWHRGLDLGLLISIAGPVTYPSARRLAEVVRALPLDRLVVETDCPYLPPQPWRGQRNEPAYLPVTAARVAELLGRPAATVADATTANAARLLGLPSRGSPRRLPVTQRPGLWRREARRVLGGALNVTTARLMNRRRAGRRRAPARPRRLSRPVGAHAADFAELLVPVQS